MDHLDEGTLQAFLDDELPPRERAAVAEHLLACAECREARDELARANTVFSEAVAVLDVETPTRSAPPVRGRGRRVAAGSFVKAAGLILLLAAAASAAVPGSPVRQLIQRALEPAPAEPVVEAPPVDVPPAPAAPAGVAMAAESGVEIRLMELDGTAIRLVQTDGESVAVSSRGAERDPTFETAPGRIEVRGAVGGEVTVEIPRSLAAARLVVDGEVYAEKTAEGLRLRVPAETVDGASVWP